MRRGPWPAGVVGESPDDAESQRFGAGGYNDLFPVFITLAGARFEERVAAAER